MIFIWRSCVTESADQLFIDEQVIQISQETGIKLVATNDTHYTYAGDAQYHEAFMCIGMNKLYDDPKRMRHSVHEFYIKSPEQMARLVCRYSRSTLSYARDCG